MTYVGDTGEINATYRPADEVEILNRPTVRNAFVATGDVTNGEFGMFQYDMAPQAGGPAAHFHRTFSESFFILEGKVRLFNGDKWVVASKGDFLYVPQGGIHAFSNSFDEPSSMLILFAPAPPREKYFRAMAEIAASGRQMTAEERTEFLASHDQYMV
ncbi:cupin [Actinophytocola xinjiangensis]|uniref:Cupin n=1 Tax=Actinophytocola xinjiangensis TaxID=485602 RepID=A0A7Z0WN17_9PSEU|nr:cupin domain-containing protein [Actinophytocola xinjiangensis]OLF11407.1 cupin [Actinophytocola xinjiangensis]